MLFPFWGQNMDSQGHPKTAAEVAKIFNGKVSSGWIHIAGPNHSSNDYSLGIKFDPNEADGFIVYSFAGDDLVECKNYVLQKLKSKELLPVNFPNFAADQTSSKAQKIKLAQSLWGGANPISGTAAYNYLKTRCCLAEQSHLRSNLRYSPSCYFGKNKSPALIGKMVHAQGDKFLGIHRTAIQPNGKNKSNFADGTANKMMLGVASNAVVKLSPFKSVLGIAEGIETALSASRHSNIPVWAVLTAGGIARFPIISNIQQLIVFSDNDCAGMDAATICAKRYSCAGMTGEIRPPPSQFKDWNDFTTQRHKEFIYDTFFREV